MFFCTYEKTKKYDKMLKFKEKDKEMWQERIWLASNDGATDNFCVYVMFLRISYGRVGGTHL